MRKVFAVFGSCNAVAAEREDVFDPVRLQKIECGADRIFVRIDARNVRQRFNAEASDQLCDLARA